ncbi:MAG: LytTR family DNA-binding domain-containing protein [Bacteroidota bacterium]
MKNIRLLIVDDEPLAHKVLESYCNKIDFVEVVGNCYDGISTINFLNKQPVDALLLDIQMPDLTGLELLDSLKNDSPKVIFTTAYTNYALQGFDYDQVIDYLHKPIRITRFLKAIERLKKQLALEQSLRSEPIAPLPIIEQNEFISLKDKKTIYKIRLTDIQYIQSWGNYLKVFLDDGDVKMVRKTIKDMEAELPTSLFERIHKSYIVHRKKVRAIEGNQVKLDEMTLPIGKSYVMLVKERLV